MVCICQFLVHEGIKFMNCLIKIIAIQECAIDFTEEMKCLEMEYVNGEVGSGWWRELLKCYVHQIVTKQERRLPQPIKFDNIDKHCADS